MSVFKDALREGLANHAKLNDTQTEPDAQAVARAWSNQRFTAADFHAWVSIGIQDVCAAMACRDAGFNPHEPADRAFLVSGVTGRDLWSVMISHGEASAAEAMAAYKGGCSPVALLRPRLEDDDG